MYKTLSAPHVLQIEVSSLCTNNCQHCYNFWRKDKNTTPVADLSLEHTDRVMDQVVENKVFHIVLTGGEPLLNKKGLFRILEQAAQSGITSGLNSTLVTLTESDAVKLKESGVSIVLTSLLGPTAEIHNQIAQKERVFEKTVRGIGLLQKAKVPVSVNMVVSKKNCHLIRETAILVKSLGLKSFNATRAGCPGNCSDFSEFSLNLQEFRSYLEDLYLVGSDEKMVVDVLSCYPLCGIKEVNRYQAFADRRCMAGVNTLTISATGDIRPCSHLDISYGNLLQDNLSEVWKRMTEWRDGSMMPVVCKTCKILPWCGGGCRMEAKTRNGSSSETDPYISIPDIDYVFGQLTSRKKPTPSLPSVVCLNRKMRWRPEEFGAAVFVGTRFGCYLNHKGLALIQSLQPNADILTADLVKRLGVGQEKFVIGLVERKVLVSSNDLERERR
jgi:pyrroloquinoline quinone biosynthesis protein E